MSKLIDIGSGFYNLRASFTFALGMIDIGTHMSFIRLSSGKFLVLDTCDISSTDKATIDSMTNNGALIEAVVATHPFHTLYFKPFHKWYPNAKYYGTPRHIRNIKEINWAGDISKPETLKLWEHENVFMRIPDGAPFDPTDEGNHFNSVWVFHQPSRSLHVDDTIMYFDHPGCLLGLAGAKHGKMDFWFPDKGLNQTATAPQEFRAFVQKVIDDWDFDNVIAAHTGNKIGGAKAELAETLRKTTKLFEDLSKKWTK